MTNDSAPLGTVASDADTPTFELVRIKLKAGKDVSPNTLVRIPVARSEPVMLIGRIRSAYEYNPNEAAEAIHLRDTMELEPSYPKEEESTTIFRVVEAELVEELYKEKGNAKTRSPQTLPQSGAEVFLASDAEIIATLGLATEPNNGLYIGDTITGIPTKIILRRQAIQRIFSSGAQLAAARAMQWEWWLKNCGSMIYPSYSSILRMNIQPWSRSWADMYGFLDRTSIFAFHP
jgi:hypothetical protein